MATKQKAPAKGKGKMVAKPADAADPDRSEALAKLALRPSVNAAAVVSLYAKPLGIGEDDIGALMGQLSDEVEKVWTGDMKRAEAMLFGQAHALQAIFMNLSRRASSQEYLKHWEAYLRMALKAQNQCRMTLETLATIKNPPVVIARQANINNGGQQQVNNGAGTPAPSAQQARHATNTPTAQTELLEQQHGQGLDVGAQGQAGQADTQLEAVGAVHRPAHR